MGDLALEFLQLVLELAQFLLFVAKFGEELVRQDDERPSDQCFGFIFGVIALELLDCHVELFHWYAHGTRLCNESRRLS